MAVKQYEAWPPRSAGELNKWPNVLILTDDFHKELRAHGVPQDRRALHALTRSALCIDIYTWLANRLHLIKGPSVTVPCAALRLQFGQDYCGVCAEDDFRTSFLLALPKCWRNTRKRKSPDTRAGWSCTPCLRPCNHESLR
uniref:replication protein RepA n=1 Tax=Acidovorax sp. DW039 TaxID=3095606 RepID=UPI00403F3AEE